MAVTRGRTPGPGTGAAAAGLCAALLAVSGLLRPLELPLRDALLRRMPRLEANRVVVVLVDEASLAAEGAWPWERGRLARLVDAAAGAGARGVVVDVLLPEPRAGDAQLAASLAGVPSVLAAGIAEDGAWLLPAP